MFIKISIITITPITMIIISSKRKNIIIPVFTGIWTGRKEIGGPF
jgi:hypothetical protein